MAPNDLRFWVAVLAKYGAEECVRSRRETARLMAKYKAEEEANGRG